MAKCSSRVRVSVGSVGLGFGLYTRWTVRHLQNAPIKNNPLEKMLYFSHGSQVVWILASVKAVNLVKKSFTVTEIMNIS